MNTVVLKSKHMQIQKVMNLITKYFERGEFKNFFFKLLLLAKSTVTSTGKAVWNKLFKKLLEKFKNHLR